MKGRMYTFDEVKELPVNTKVWYESELIPGETRIIRHDINGHKVVLWKNEKSYTPYNISTDGFYQMEVYEWVEDAAPYELIGKELGQLVQKKNNQYGDSVNNTSKFLEILFPEGIPVERYKEIGTLVRIYDKIKRIANGNQGEENAWRDIAGYAILMCKDDSYVQEVL